MDNLAIARILSEIADLLEIKAENPFKIRAYRNAADTVANATNRLSACSNEQLLALAGIGKDLAAKIREICETGGAAYHRELLEQFPSTVLDLLHLQGVGPKTVSQLYTQLGISTLEQLEQACHDGRIRELKGMGKKKEALILKALDERSRHHGRHLLPEAADAGALFIEFLQAAAPNATFTQVGSVRRGAETAGDIDILAAGAEPSITDVFTSYRLVERVLGRGDTKSSVLIWGGIQADLRLVPADSTGAALQYFTGSKSHNIVLRDRAMARGLKLNEYGLFRVDDGTKVAGASEAGVYAALGLQFVPPELRENRGEVEAAERQQLPTLIELTDLRGDLHTHSTETDGRDDVEAMARAARDAGLTYLAVTDHSKALAMANGLDEHRALAHAAHVREIGARLEGITLLAGIECDIRPDGTMDLSDDCLAQLDIVIASVHSAFNQEEAEMTDRVLRAIACPYVDVLGHPTGRLLLKRDPYQVSVGRMIDAAARAGVALEINCQVDRLDLCDTHARLARDRGAQIIISSDAHNRGAFQALRWGVMVARRAWLTAGDVLNTRPLDAFKAGLRRHTRLA